MIKSDDQDDLREFLEEITRGWKDWSHQFATYLSDQVIAELARLAKVSDTALFHRGITSAAWLTFVDKERFSKPIYKGQVTDRLDSVLRQAIFLEHQLAELLDTRSDPATSTAKELISEILDLRKPRDAESEESALDELRHAVGSLVWTIELAKFLAARRGFATRGRPKGVGKAGIAMNKFIARLEFAARAAGGNWTLNKNDERGTLISALKLLKGYLPKGFVPSGHPYATYQRVLTKARFDWDNSPLPRELMSHLDQK